jgi:hypothetical protein
MPNKSLLQTGDANKSCARRIVFFRVNRLLSLVSATKIMPCVCEALVLRYSRLAVACPVGLGYDPEGESSE